MNVRRLCSIDQENHAKYYTLFVMKHWPIEAKAGFLFRRFSVGKEMNPGISWFNVCKFSFYPPAARSGGYDYSQILTSLRPYARNN